MHCVRGSVCTVTLAFPPGRTGEVSATSASGRSRATPGCTKKAQIHRAETSTRDTVVRITCLPSIPFALLHASIGFRSAFDWFFSVHGRAGIPAPAAEGLGHQVAVGRVGADGI